jgi:nucleotide-binding universal stress UspA family protein
MVKIILAVDGSEPSFAATQAVIKHRAMFNSPVDIHLVHVAAPIPKLYGVHVVVDHATIDSIVREDAEQAMMASVILFEKWGVAYKKNNFVGEVARVINEFADAEEADFIYIGAHGRGNLLNTIRGVILGSTATKLLHAANVPVVVVHASKL